MMGWQDSLSAHMQPLSFRIEKIDYGLGITCPKCGMYRGMLKEKIQTVKTKYIELECKLCGYTFNMLTYTMKKMLF